MDLRQFGIAEMAKEKKTMPQLRGIVGCLCVAACVLFYAPTRASAQHLDRRETRRGIRRVEERTDAMLDHVDDWIESRGDEGEHRVEELYARVNAFNDTLGELKVEFHERENPWELRAHVRELIRRAGEMGHEIRRIHEFGDDVHHDWEDVRSAVFDLADKYRLEHFEEHD
jgi:hypothetical protein